MPNYRADQSYFLFATLCKWHALTLHLIVATNAAVVNSDTVCEPLREITVWGLAGPITPVLGIVRY